MSISVSTGFANRAGVPVSYFTFPAFVVVSGDDIVVGMCMQDPSVTVTGITDSAGNTYTFRIGGSDGLRVEVWEAQSCTPNGSTFITVTLSGTCRAVGAYQIYKGVTPQASLLTPQDTTEAHGLGSLIGTGVATQESGNWVVGILGFEASELGIDAFHEGTVINIKTGRLRQRVMDQNPGGIGLVLMDVAGLAYATPTMSIRLNKSVHWGSVALELRAGGATVDPSGKPITPSGTVYPWYYSYVVTGTITDPGTTAEITCSLPGGGCADPNDDTGNSAF